jgi:hypothetical protein
MSANPAKPHFIVIAGRPVSVPKATTPVDAARKRFGKPFAHEEGSTWKPRETPLLAEWLASRIQEKG